MTQHYNTAFTQLSVTIKLEEAVIGAKFYCPHAIAESI